MALCWRGRSSNESYEGSDALELKKGKYVPVCFISDRKGGPPHVAKGMISEATVE